MRLQHTLSIVLIVVVAGLLLWVSGRYTWNADWTAGNRNSVTPASRRVLAAMPGKITFTAFAAPGPVRQNIRDDVDRYRRADADVQLKFVDPAEHPAEIRKLGIRRNGELRVTYRGRHETLKGLSEQQATSALQRLSTAGAQWVVFLSGHGERDPQDRDQGGYSTLRKALDRQGLKVRGLNLAASPRIPANTAVLVIASPQRKLLPGEVKLIGQYVKKGGNLLWLNDPSDPSDMQEVADRLGLQWLEGTVMYPDYKRLGTGSPAIALVIGYPRSPISAHMDGLTVFPYAGGVAANKKAGGHWHAVPLLQTPKRSWLETGSLKAGTISYDKAQGDRLGPINIGMAVSRPRPAPAGDGDTGNGNKDKGKKAAKKPAKATQHKNKHKHGQQRAVLVADSDFLTNANINTVSNLQLGAALFQWLAYRDKQIAVHVPPAPDSSLQLAPWQGRGIWWGFVVLLPLLLLATGVGRWWLRRRR